MKIISIAIPCYNSMEYMHKAVESCLAVREDAEIIIVDDGSKDETARIGDELSEKYPDCIKCVHQENGGHGQAVNTGLKNATGVYFKVLDSDDWFDTEALKKAVGVLKELHESENDVDMFIANYVYDKPSENKQNTIRYTNVMPQDTVFTWDSVGHFLPHQNILMHSVMYRRQMLLDCGLELPKHTFYVDNLFVYQPLPSVKKMYYADLDLYHYFIGRQDQSVNEKVLISRIDQQIRVNKMMMDCCDITALENKNLRAYMTKYLTMLTAVSTVLLIKSGTEENLKKRDELWDYLKSKPELYKAVDRTAMGHLVQMNTAVGRAAIKEVYSIAQKMFSFN